MRVVICAMAKNEHLYINEWVKHYVDLGIDKIYLYDNDDKNSPFIGNYINRKYADKIKIINIRGMSGRCMQHTIYSSFYNRFCTTFDYCLFCDIDEFLVGIDNIKTWLSKINAPQIRIKWRLFGDDNVIKRDTNIPVIDFFKQEVIDIPHERKDQGKFIIKGNLYKISFNSCHYASVGKKIVSSVLPSGKPCNSKIVIEEDYSEETIYLNHYMTKTLDEFIKQKLNRNDAVFNRNLKLDYFWRINEKTEDKIQYLKDMGLED